MRRNDIRRRPELESLESKTLLSALPQPTVWQLAQRTAAARPTAGPEVRLFVPGGHTITTRHALRAAETLATTGALAISGNLSGRFAEHTSSDGAGHYGFFVDGKLSIGRTFVAGAINTPATTAGGLDSGTLIMANPYGSIRLHLQQVLLTPSASTMATPSSGVEIGILSFQWTVKAGTGKYHNATGTGSVTVQLQPGGLPGPDHSTTGKITLTFNGAPT